jgi:pyruvate,water dikinase
MLAIAGAIVLEMGGPLSHGAIVARELAIPAVVNVGNATRELVSGERIAVDGGSGSIRRV